MTVGAPTVGSFSTFAARELGHYLKELTKETRINKLKEVSFLLAVLMNTIDF
jgi:hypothetical protein